MRVTFGVRYWIGRLLLSAFGLLTCAAANPSTTPRFDVLGYELAANQDTPELCFAFSGLIARQPAAPLESFITTEPAVKLAATPRGQRLCLTGFGFGSVYTVSVKAGLPGTAGALDRDSIFAITIPNRPPEVDFARADADILPRLPSRGLPIRSVNTPKIAVEIFQMSDRDIIPSRWAPLSNPNAPASSDPQWVEKIWDGTLDTNGMPNRDTVTRLQVESIVGTLKPGLYEAVATEADAPVARAAQPRAVQFFAVSDLGLAAYLGCDSLLVSVRSLASEAAAAGVDVALIGLNNRELARLRTDGSGFARFDSSVVRGVAGNQPQAIHAFGAAGEFSWLDLRAAPPAAGRSDCPATGSARAMIDAGSAAYRPGDTARLAVFLRNDQGNAVQKLPLMVEVARPDGAIFDSRVLTDQGAGAYDTEIDFPPAGPIGTWTVRAYLDGTATPVGATGIQVGNAPQPALAVAVGTEAAVIDPSQPQPIDIEGDYAYGAPAAGIPGELHATIAAATNPFPAFSDFSFGVAGSAVGPIALDTIRFVTDAAGRASVSLKLPSLPSAPQPLEVALTGRLFDAGEISSDHRITVPIATGQLQFGIRPVGGANFAEGQTAHFDVVAVSADGARQEKSGAGWEIIREDLAPAWSGLGSRFAYRETVKDTHIAGGLVDIPIGPPAALTANLPPGRYRVEVFDPTGEAATSAPFQVGSTGQGAAGEVESLEIKPAKPAYGAGESAELFVKPPFDSEVTLVAADNAVRNAVIQHVPASGAVMHVDVPRDAAAGLYAMATALAPPVAPGAAPRRVTGAVWLAADPTPRRLDVTIDGPPAAPPLQTLSLPVTVAGAGDEPVFMTVRAFGERNPDEDAGAGSAGLGANDPVSVFLGRRPQAVAMRDLYNRIIDTGDAPVSSPIDDGERRPAVAAAAAVSDPAQFSLYSGIVALDRSGRATIPLAIPDFQGTLGIVVNAWSANRVGHAEARTMIRDPLVLKLPAPPVLAPDDRVDLALSLDNESGPRGEYRIQVNGEGAVSIAGTADLTANLAEHEQRALPVSVLAHAPGAGVLTLSLAGPDGIAFTRRLDVTVKPADAPIARRQMVVLKPGTSLTIDPSLTIGLRPDSVSESLSITVEPTFDTAGLVRQLATTDGGSAAQIIDEAIPDLIALTPDQAAGDKTRRATLRLLGLQGRDGGFGLWGGQSDPWLSAYVLDFLTRAKAAGVTFPEAALTRGLDYLGLQIGPRADQAAGGPDASAQPGLETGAYAAAILAKNRRLDLFHLRYFADRFVPQMHGKLALGWTAAAFATLGDKNAASAIFADAAALADAAASADGFGSDLRDQAILTALMAESKAAPSAELAAALGKAADLAMPRRQFGTTEAAWLLRAIAAMPAGAMPEAGNALKLKVGDQIVEQSGPYRMTGATPPPIKSLGLEPLRVAVTVTGVPTGIDTKDSGFEIERWFFDPSGKPADPASTRQDELLVVVLTGRFTGQGEVHPILIDGIPAGWTIMGIQPPGTSERFPWLKDLTGTAYASSADGRYFAAPSLVGDRREFKLAYVVRAVTRGQFTLPGAFIEDTTQPWLSARTGASRVRVDPVP